MTRCHLTTVGRSALSVGGGTNLKRTSIIFRLPLLVADLSEGAVADRHEVLVPLRHLPDGVDQLHSVESFLLRHPLLQLAGMSFKLVCGDSTADTPTLTAQCESERRNCTIIDQTPPVRRCEQSSTCQNSAGPRTASLNLSLLSGAGEQQLSCCS